MVQIDQYNILGLFYRLIVFTESGGGAPANCRLMMNIILDKPNATISLGKLLHHIKVGDDVYFECLVKSKPSTFKVAWTHNVSLNLMHIPLEKFSYT